MFEIYDGKTDFTQWDINQKLIVKDQTIKEVHFSNDFAETALICVPYEIDGLLVVDVPNILLQEAMRIYVHAFCGECVRAAANYEVKPRVKPSDYVYTETEVKNYEDLESRLAEVEEDLSTAANDIEALSVAIAEKSSGYEWITIADTTLKENVASFEITTDANGNPFKCKEIIMSVSLANTHGVAGQDWYFGKNAECKVTWQKTGGHVLSMKCCAPTMQHYQLYPYSFNLNTSFYVSAFRYDTVDVIDKIKLMPPTDNPLLSGDRIRIVGVKA